MKILEGNEVEYWHGYQGFMAPALPYGQKTAFGMLGMNEKEVVAVKQVTALARPNRPALRLPAAGTRLLPQPHHNCI